MIARLLSFWYPPAPATRLALLRIAMGSFALVYLLIRAANLTSVTAFHASELKLVGVVSVLSQPLSTGLVHASVALAIASGVLFVAGAHYRVSGPLFAALVLWVTSYRSSWGMIFHTDNLLTLHLLLLAIAPAADALSWDARRKRASVDTAEHGRYGWVIRTMAIVTACTYVVAGVAKLKLAGSEWLGGELLRSQIAFDNLRKIELGSGYSTLGVWLVRHPIVFAPLAVATMLVELGAPLALLNRRLALVWIAAAWGFHVGVVLMMHIGFPYQLALVAYLPLLPVERALRFWPRLKGVARATS